MINFESQKVLQWSMEEGRILERVAAGSQWKPFVGVLVNDGGEGAEEEGEEECAVVLWGGESRLQPDCPELNPSSDTY